MGELFSDAAARLAEHPKLGTLGKIPGTRELIPHESYRLVYEIDACFAAIKHGLKTCRVYLSNEDAATELYRDPIYGGGKVSLHAWRCGNN